MSAIVDAINFVTAKVIDLILYPFQALSPSWQIIIISLLSGVLLIFLYGLVSNQAAIKKVKRRISASILEVILYRHDLKLCLKAQGRMFLAGGKYFALAVPPLIILMIPCILILSQLNLRYESRPLKAGESVLLTAKPISKDMVMETKLNIAEGVQGTQPVRIPSESEVTWRLTAERDGLHKILLQTPDAKVEKQILASFDQEGRPFYSKMYSSPIWSILYPVQNREFAKHFSAIEITYPSARHYLFGLELHWVIIFFIVSLVSGLIAAKFFKVEI